MEPDEQLREFLRDRYRHTSIKGTPPSGPFCSCGLQRDEHKKDAIDAAPADVANRERHIAESIRRSRSSHNKRTSPSPLRSEYVNRSQSPLQRTPPPLSSDWNVLTDTIEEPTDVAFEQPISWEQHHQENEISTGPIMSSSLENLSLAPRVSYAFSLITYNSPEFNNISS